MDLHGAPGFLGTPHPFSGLPPPRGGPSSVRIPAQTHPPSDSKGLGAGWHQQVWWESAGG